MGKERVGRQDYCPNVKGVICIFTFYSLDNNESMAKLVSQKHS